MTTSSFSMFFEDNVDSGSDILRPHADGGSTLLFDSTDDSECCS